MPFLRLFIGQNLQSLVSLYYNFSYFCRKRQCLFNVVHQTVESLSLASVSECQWGENMHCWQGDVWNFLAFVFGGSHNVGPSIVALRRRRCCRQKSEQQYYYILNSVFHLCKNNPFAAIPCNYQCYFVLKNEKNERQTNKNHYLRRKLYKIKIRCYERVFQSSEKVYSPL